MILTTGALIAAAGATAGAVGSSANRRWAREEESRNYRQSRDYLNSMYYRDPLSTVGNRSLLKTARESYRDNLDAINNRMVAGGATMENQLAARQANNEAQDRLYAQLLRSEDARRDNIERQRMQLDARHSASVQGGYMQAAQDWQSWGSAIGQAALFYGSSQLLGGMSGAASTAPQRAGAYGQVLSGGLASVNTPGVTGPELDIIRR